jgi:hypothetical protein
VKANTIALFKEKAAMCPFFRSNSQANRNSFIKGLSIKREFSNISASIAKGHSPRLTSRSTIAFEKESSIEAFLIDESISKNTLAPLYWCRWDIEECFKLEKET